MLMETGIALALAVGNYVGEGTWHDSTNASHRYQIEMRIERLGNGNVRQWFKHIFFEEGGQVIEQTADYVFRENGIFDLLVVGAPLQGRGYCSVDACHYSLPIPNNLVEVTQFFFPGGSIKTIGSAEKNAQGNYIWWEEQVSRQ